MNAPRGAEKVVTPLDVRPVLLRAVGATDRRRSDK